MGPFLGAALILGALMMARDDERAPTSTAPRPTRDAMVALIRAESARQGLPAAIALAFAEVESDLNPSAIGDKQWAQKHPDLFARLVRDNPTRARNPARLDPSLWRSYGLYQLLAPYHARPLEHPEALLDPALNARRGIAYIKSLLAKYGDDLAQARLAYAGALQASRAEQDRVLARFSQIYQRWSESGVA